MVRSVLLFALMVPSFAAAKSITASVIYLNVNEGFDHENRMLVFVDGQQVAETGVKMESQLNTVKFKLPKGAQVVRLVNFARYEGNWEEHTVENDYSMDCLIEVPVAPKAPKRIDLVCDIDAGARLQ